MGQPPPVPVQPVTLKQHAYQIIRTKILTGAIPPGGRLSDDALAREIGIGRSQVREAISQLGGEGLVDCRPRSGAYVKIPTRRDLDEFYEVRLVLEPFAAERAAELATAEDLDNLQMLNAQMGEIVEECRGLSPQIADEERKRRFLDLDSALHSSILKVAGNNRLTQMVRECKLMTVVFGHVPTVHDVRLLEEAHQQHQEVIEQMARKDGRKAAAAMRRHIDSAWKGLRRSPESAGQSHSNGVIPAPVERTNDKKASRRRQPMSPDA